MRDPKSKFASHAKAAAASVASSVAAAPPAEDFAYPQRQRALPVRGRNQRPSYVDDDMEEEPEATVFGTI